MFFLKKIKTTLFLLFILFSLSNLNAQTFKRGKIITRDKQTIIGEIKDFGPQLRCIKVYFRKQGESGLKEYLPQDLEQYEIFGTGTYQSSKVELEDEIGFRDFFLKVLSTGEFNTYRLDFEQTPESSIQAVQLSKIFYIVKSDRFQKDKIFDRENYRGFMNQFTICPEQNEEKKYGFYDSEIVEFLTKVAACENKEVKSFAKSTKNKKILAFSIGGGINSVKIDPDVTRLNGGSFENALSPSFIFSIDFIITDNLSLISRLQYYGGSFDGTTNHIVADFYGNAGEIITLNHNIKVDYIGAGFMGKYKHDTPKFSPYILGGIKFGQKLNHEVRTEEISFIVNDNGETVQFGRIDRESSRLWIGQETGLIFGGGVTFKLSKLNPFLEFNFQRSKADSNIDPSFQSFGILAGIQF